MKKIWLRCENKISRFADSKVSSNVDEKETGDDVETCCIIFASGNFLEDGEREREL